MTDDFEYIEKQYTELFDNNQYLIKIKGEKRDWVIFIYKNIHIKLDIETNTAITSKTIDVTYLCNFLCDKNNFKIVFKHYEDDLQLYIDTIKNILHNIEIYYNMIKKTIEIETKICY
jgi:hypothetical protein